MYWRHECIRNLPVIVLWILEGVHRYELHSLKSLIYLRFIGIDITYYVINIDIKETMNIIRFVEFSFINQFVCHLVPNAGTTQNAAT